LAYINCILRKGRVKVKKTKVFFRKKIIKIVSLSFREEAVEIIKKII